jgi:endonuclease/exonuclease/phosphatase family metal-dependent hydrolase
VLSAWLLTACRSPSTDDGTPPPTDTPAGHTAAPPRHTGGPTTDTAPPGDGDLVVLSLNLHCLKLDGTPYATNADRFAAVAREVADQGVDAIAAQEVCVGAEDARTLLLDALAAETGVGWDLRWVEAHRAWEGTPDEADEGVAVVARRPITAVRELAYATPGTLRRVALAATLADGPTLVTVHLDYDDPAAREDQARQTAVAALIDGPDAIVAGDFNARPGEPAPAALYAAGFVDATTALDPARIDHVFVHRGASVAPADAALVLLDVSDHPGVLVTLSPRPAPSVALTRLVAQVDVGFGRWVAVRGDPGPLSWDRGSWAVPVAADRWEWVSTELDAPFAFKALRDDVAWETGPDHAGTPGDVTTFAPTFP